MGSLLGVISKYLSGMFNQETVALWLTNGHFVHIHLDSADYFFKRILMNKKRTSTYVLGIITSSWVFLLARSSQVDWLGSPASHFLGNAKHHIF